MQLHAFSHIHQFLMCPHVKQVEILCVFSMCQCALFSQMYVLVIAPNCHHLRQLCMYYSHTDPGSHFTITTTYFYSVLIALLWCIGSRKGLAVVGQEGLWTSRASSKRPPVHGPAWAILLAV